jgi:hypothetical protein
VRDFELAPGARLLEAVAGHVRRFGALVALIHCHPRRKVSAKADIGNRRG